MWKLSVASAIYGDGATGGVINIITKRADTDRLTSKTEFGVNAALGELEEDSFRHKFTAYNFCQRG